MTTRTREEVEALKRNWLTDPCYDLEDVGHGFEAYRDELHDFSSAQEEKWVADREQSFKARAVRYGISDSPILAQYLTGVEATLTYLIERFEALEARLGETREGLSRAQKEIGSLDYSVRRALNDR